MSAFCSLCQVEEAGPYCLEHGLVHQPFSIAGRYDVEELIGEPVAPFVFGAHDRATGTSVAIKVVRSQAAGAQVAGADEVQQRFLREAAVLSEFSHEHIVGVVDFGWDDVLGAAYLVMERLSGQTAEALVRRTGPLPWKQAIPLLVQICRALVAAHQHGIIDGSLTAKKVFLVHGAVRPVVKLCGFGFTSADQPPDGTKTTDPRSDIYGIGTIAHELLTGRPPLEGSRASGSLTDDPISMNEWMPALALPDKLDELIRECRARNPMLRPTLVELQATLLSVGAASGVWEAAETKVTETYTVQEDPLAVPEMIGSYRVVGELGEGGTGRVYLGQHPVIGSKVAIKVLLPEIASSTETVNRFIQEARASSQIGSPHIPRYFDFGTTPAGLPYAIMEYFDGETLGKRLTRVGTMSVAETAQILTPVASALLMAHDAGLIHRDLKPDNILLVNPDNKAARSTAKRAAPIGSGSVAPAIEVKVLDFGIAKMVGTPSPHQTLTGSFLGTPFYCAPEQVFGHEVDARTDVYSLGATAFEMLTGAPPFTGLVPEVLSSKATLDPPDLRSAGIPAAVAHTIRKMLAREPDRRAPSMAWVLEEVASWAPSDELGARSPARVKPPVDRIHQHDSEDPDETKLFARAETVPPESDGDADRDPATTSKEMRVVAPPRGRRRKRTALLITGVLAVAAPAVLIGVSWLRSITPASSRPHDVQDPPTGSATARAVPPPPPPAPLDSQAGTHAPSTPPTVGSPAPASVEPGPVPVEPASVQVEGAGSKLEGAGSNIEDAPPSSRASGRSPSDGRAPKLGHDHAASGSAAPRHPGTKPPPGKKPPAKKPPPGDPKPGDPKPGDPKPGDPKDVLIVDPFSHGN